MDFEEFEQYITQVENDSKFKKLDEFLHMFTYREGRDKFENIKEYLSIHRSKPYDTSLPYNSQAFFQPDYDYCVEFLEHYLKDNPIAILKTEDNYIDLYKNLNMKQPIRFAAGTGTFFDGCIILTDGTKYITKEPVYEKNCNVRMNNKYSIYSPLIASYIAKSIGVEAAEASLGRLSNGKIRNLSKNFLRENEELITFANAEKNETISGYLEEIEEQFGLRKYPVDNIQKAKFEALKKEFVAKLCGLKDQTNQNDPMIIGCDENGNKYLKIAPMFDLDYSFHIAAQEKPDMLTRKCDNGKTDIASLIMQYKDYPGFKEFVINAINTLNMRRIFNQIYEDTGIEKFKEGNDPEMNKFIQFVNENAQLAKETIATVYGYEREVGE